MVLTILARYSQGTPGEPHPSTNEKEITMRDEIEHYWHELVCVMQAVPFDTLVSAAELLLDCYRRSSTVFILGNGGSAATASHFACDLSKRTRTSGLPAW